MRAILILCVSYFATSTAFAGSSICHGSHQVVANWDKSLLTIDGKTFQMHKDKNGKKSFTLRGNDMTFSHTPTDDGKFHNVLHMNGQTEVYHCRRSNGEDDT